MDEEGGSIVSGENYKFDLSGTDWSREDTPLHPSIKAIYESPSKNTILTLREVNLDKETSLKDYVVSWIRDYARYSFDISKKGPTRLNNQRAYFISSVHRETQKQLRQVVFLRGKRSIVLTCQSSEADNELKSCPKLFKNFRWNSKN